MGAFCHPITLVAEAQAVRLGPAETTPKTAGNGDALSVPWPHVQYQKQRPDGHTSNGRH